MKEDDPIDLNQERILNQQIASLAIEEETPCDLWSEIESKIIQSKIKVSRVQPGHAKRNKNSWALWAIAASLLISVSSLMLSWHNLQQAQNIYAQINMGKNSQETIYKKSVHYKIDLMETEFKLAKVELMSRISMNRAHINKTLLAEIENELTAVHDAAKLLKLAIERQPDSTEFPRLLRATYQQELAVLTQLAKLDTSI